MSIVTVAWTVWCSWEIREKERKREGWKCGSNHSQRCFCSVGGALSLSLSLTLFLLLSLSCSAVPSTVSSDSLPSFFWEEKVSLCHFNNEKWVICSLEKWSMIMLGKFTVQESNFALFLCNVCEIYSTSGQNMTWRKTPKVDDSRILGLMRKNLLPNQNTVEKGGASFSKSTIKIRAD